MARSQRTTARKERRAANVSVAPTPIGNCAVCRLRQGRRKTAAGLHASTVRELWYAGSFINRLYYGDNLTVLRGSFSDETVDLVYLDPPFNSRQDYNVLFRGTSGEQSHAQIQAFDDTWHWGDEAELAFDGVMTGQNSDAAEMLRAMRAFLKENDMMAYLSMMAVRLVELNRVLKPAGSICLHCDPTASHYLKILMDAIFDPRHFRNEIIWQRTSAHANVIEKFGAVHDVILFYSKSDSFTWNQQYVPFTPEYIETFFDDADELGRRYFRRDLTASMSRASIGQLYEWHGIKPPPSRCWAMAKERMDEREKAGRIHWPKKEGGMPRLKMYPEDSLGVPIQDIWSDVKTMHNLSSERLGYRNRPAPTTFLARTLSAGALPIRS